MKFSRPGELARRLLEGRMAPAERERPQMSEVWGEERFERLGGVGNRD